MITSKITKGVPEVGTDERMLKLLESIDWKLWEMYNMMKDNLPEKPKTAKAPKPATKKEATPE
jgi:hypothetical protein